MSGFFALPRTVFANADRLDPIGYKIGLELMVKCHCKSIGEIPIHFADRKLGKSKLSIKEQLNYIRHIGRLKGHVNHSRQHQRSLV
jgi:dolichol-phosphate mannosyltransferase